MIQSAAYRGSIFYFQENAVVENLSNQYIYIEDGLLIIEAGKIKAVGQYLDLKDKILNIELKDYKNKLITPGFIDTHQHACQSAIVASCGKKLLEWLNEYVYPKESYYADDDYARTHLNFFLDELLKNGTTTAVSYGPLFYNATDIFFEVLKERNMRFITGNIIMEKNAPDYLTLSAQKNYDNARKLIKKWHNTNRLSFCISPRFALSCSEELLELCGSLKKEFPDTYVQTHLDENLSEIKQAREIFPQSKNYMDVYARFGLVTDKTIFGHCIYLTEAELELFKSSKAIIASCPLSNNFLGSGLFNIKKVLEYTDKITLGTDWGAGNSLSMFAVMEDLYKVAMLNNYAIPILMRWYLCTLGAAKALGLSEKVGNFTPGKEADFIVIDPYASSYLTYRLDSVSDILEQLSVLMVLGDDRNISATYIAGDLVYHQK